MSTIITKNSKETQALGRKLVGKMQGGEVICLSGELGSGKTTFTQGFLESLGAEGPYTSPTFLIMKQYEIRRKNKEESKKQKKEIQNIYHIDAYRVGEKDVADLGWEEIIADKKNIVIVEWAERIKNIVPQNALWIKFEWLNENERKITLPDQNF